MVVRWRPSGKPWLSLRCTEARSHATRGLRRPYSISGAWSAALMDLAVAVDRSLLFRYAFETRALSCIVYIDGVAMGMRME